jgi:type I restriction enzyme M protein
MQVTGFEDKVAFIWSVADILRGEFKAHEFGQVILPFTVLRRLECALAPRKEDVVARGRALEGNVPNVDPILRSVAKHEFYNTSPPTLAKLLSDPVHVPGTRPVPERVSRRPRYQSLPFAYQLREGT